MTRMFIRHTVQDYPQWRQAYDDFQPTRDRMGVTHSEVFQDADDDKAVTVIHDFADLGSAQALAGSSELREAMQNAGVASAPDIWFTEEA